MESKRRERISTWVALLVGSSLGGLIGLRGGAVIAMSRDGENTVSLSEYRRECNECEKIGMLYYAERKRNVHLTGKHLPAERVAK